MSTERTKAIGGIATGISLFVLTSALTVWALNIATEDPPVTYGGEVPCATEDSTDCYWDADTMGNGEGASFYVTPSGDLIPWCTDALADAGATCFGPIKP